MKYILHWDGVNWDSVGSIGVPGSSVKALKYKDDLFAGGNFGNIGTLTCNKIARWDGTNWSDLDGGLTGGLSFDAMAIYNDELYCGGSFAFAGFPSYITVNGIARWNGTEWNTVGNGVNDAVITMVVDTIQNVLYVGGFFTKAISDDDTINVGGVAKWDGTKWSDVGGGVNNNTIYTLGIYRGDLYVGGSFNMAGNVPANNIARWDGIKWDSLGVGTSLGTVLALEVYKDELYVGGNFETAGGDTAYGIARWYVPPCYYYSANFGVSADTVFLSDSGIVQFYDSSTTTAQWFWDFGDSETDTLQNPVHSYSSAGTYLVTLISTYSECSDTAEKYVTVIDDTVGMDKLEVENYELKIYPNPTEDSFTVEAYISENKNGVIKIYGLKGELLKKYKLNKGNNRTLVHTSGWKKGIYICNFIINGKVIKSEKMVVE